MSALGDCKKAALINQGYSGTAPDMEKQWLIDQTGVTDGDTGDLWKILLFSLGYSGSVPDMQKQSWKALSGLDGAWNDLAVWFWCVNGGVYGPSVRIEPQGTVPPAGYCEWTGLGTCTASRQYLAVDTGFTNPANQWVWSIDPPVAGVAITLGQGTNTVTVETQNFNVDTAFNLKVVATDTVSTDTAERTAEQTQYHREDLAVTDIVEDAAGSCTYDSGLGESSCVSQSTYSATVTGTPDTYLWSVSDVTGGTAQIVGSATSTTCVVQTTGGAPSVGYNVSLDLTSQFQTAQRSESFTQTKTDLPTPVFIGPDIDTTVLAQNVAMTPFDVSPRFTGQDVGGYLLVGSWPAGLSIDANGVLSGTPTDPVADYDNLQFSASNANGATLSNLFTVTIAAGETAPVFIGPNVPNQPWDVGVPVTLDLRPLFTGSAATYTVTTGVLPTGLTLDPSGIISGTPTTEGETDTLVVTATNGAGADTTNSFIYAVWADIVFSGPIANQTFTVDTPYSFDTSTYFTGTVQSWAINGTWPPGFAIDGSGVITGTATVEASYTGLSVTASNTRPDSATSNTFTGDAVAASGPAFYALTPDTTDDYRMVGVLTGTGGLTTVHTADLYAPDMNGVYQKYPANAPVWKNGRVVLTGGAGTDVVSVHGNDAPAGTPLAEVPYLHKQGALENILTYSNTFTNVIWSQQGGISITQDQTGLTGVANGAAIFDDQDAGNASYLRQSTIAVTGDIITARVWIKKDATQPGRFPCIEISNNGAEAAYQLKVDTDTGAFHINADNANKFGSVRDAGNWWEVLCQVTSAGATSINQFRIYPAFTTTLSGNVVVSATGSIVVGQAEIYSGEAYQKVAQTSPIFTVAATAATDRTAYSFDYANHDNVKGAWYAETQPSFNNADLGSGGLDSHSNIMTFQLNDYWNLMWYDKSAANRIASRGSAESRVTYVWTRGLDMKHGVAYAAGDNQHQMVVDGTDGTLVTFTQFPSIAPTISLGSTSASATDLATGYREIQRFDVTDFADAKSIIDGLMTP